MRSSWGRHVLMLALGPRSVGACGGRGGGALPLASERLVGNPRRAHREEQQWCALGSGVGHPPPGGVADQAELSTAWIVLEESVEVGTQLATPLLG